MRSIVSQRILMPPLATIGTLIEVSPRDELQHWPDSDAACSFIDDPSPFRFRVAGELTNEGHFFGLYGPVESGPARYSNLICNIFLRIDDSDWHREHKCGASFKVGPSIAERVASYNPAEHSEAPFHLHPEGTFVRGYPQTSRFGGIQVVDEPMDEANG